MSDVEEEKAAPGQNAPWSWWKIVAGIGVAFGFYVLGTLAGTWVFEDAVAGAATGAIFAFVVFLLMRVQRTGTPLAKDVLILRPGAFAATCAVALLTAWLFGQTASAAFYRAFGDSAYDVVAQARLDSSVWLIAITVLVLAPLGEEALLRGTVYSLLRDKWPPLAAAFVTAAIFSILHGNLVQILLTLPLGLVLALVYEISQRLWVIVLMHAAFNVASSFVPRDAVESLAQPSVVAASGIALVLSLLALRPSLHTAQPQ